MTEHDNNSSLVHEQVTEPSVKPKRFYSNTPTWQLALFIIILGAMCFMGEFYICLYNKLDEFENKVNLVSELSLQQKKLLDVTTADIQYLSLELNKVKDQVRAKAEQFQAIEAAIKNMANKSQNPDTQAKLIGIENLVSFAEQKLVQDYNVNSAKQLLHVAESALQNDTDLTLINVRKIILQKINELNQIEPLDIIKISADLEQLNAAIEQVTAIDLMVDINRATNYSQDTQNLYNYDKENNSKWQNALNTMKQDLLNLVSIRKIGDDDNLAINKLLDDRQISLIKLYFKLRITDALISLKLHDDRSYVLAINDIEQNINKYFSANSKLSTKLLAMLASSKDINLKPKYPEFRDVYPALKTAGNAG